MSKVKQQTSAQKKTLADMSTQELVDKSLKLGRQYTLLELEMNKVAEEVEKRGTSVNDVLKEREKQNGQEAEATSS